MPAFGSWKARFDVWCMRCVSHANCGVTFARFLLQITLGLSVKSDEVIKEQQLVLQLNVAKQDALAKFDSRPLCLTQTPNPKP